MDSRSFVIGLICGAILGVSAGWLLGGNDEKEVDASADKEANSAIVPEIDVVVPTATNDTQQPPAAADPNANDPQTSGGNGVKTVTPWPANSWVEFELEPKDDSWAYYMEQTLLQFLSSHPSIAQFDVSRIECRTTKCQIEVIGYDESTIPVWHQVLYDIRQQPWSEFGQSGYSSGTIDGRVTIVGSLQWITEEH